MNTITCDKCKERIKDHAGYHEYAEYVVSNVRVDDVFKRKRHLCLVCELEFRKWLEKK